MTGRERLELISFVSSVTGNMTKGPTGDFYFWSYPDGRAGEPAATLDLTDDAFAVNLPVCPIGYALIGYCVDHNITVTDFDEVTYHKAK